MKFVDETALTDLLFHGMTKGNKIFQYFLDLEEPIAISCITVPVLMREGRRRGISDKTIGKLIKMCHLIDSSKEDYQWALLNERSRDFEGALQVSAALRRGCSGFATAYAARARDYESVIATEYIAPPPDVDHSLRTVS